MKETVNKVSVWDTYVIKDDGVTMHFDIVVPTLIKDANVVYEYGQSYLKSKELLGLELNAKQCQFCHIEQLRPAWETAIEEKGYFIIEMEGCN